MKKLKVIASLVLAGIMLTTPFSVNAKEKSDYTISSPYQNINWNTVNTYKTALHTHTNASDGRLTLRESLERHAETGFDIVATTDHGTVSYSWSEKNTNKFVYGLLSLVGKSEGELDYLSDKGTFANGMSYTVETASNGDDYLKLENGKTILRVPFGIENNAVSANAHVNSWFADYCDNSLSTHNDSIRGVDKAGGVSVINHPGQYTKARFELYEDKAYDLDNFSYRYYVNKFARLLDKYDSCIGIDVNSDGDEITRYDRKLWDILLEKFSAKGENIFGIASSDSHSQYITDSGFTYVMMPEKTSSALRKALESGEFFAGSHFIGNRSELIAISEGIKQFYGETAVYKNIVNTIDIMNERISGIESGKYEADSKIDTQYKTVDSDGYCTAETQPMITGVNVDENNDTISLNCKDALIVRWISNGKQIAVTRADDATIDLNDYASSLGDYVRAEVFGEGGVIYTQAFLLNAEEKGSSASAVDGIFVDVGFCDCLFAVIHNTIRQLKITIAEKF